MPNANDVPMMFRSQLPGRSQLQFLSGKEEEDSERWVREWTKQAYPQAPQFGDREVETYTCKIRWRFVTNGGQDDGIIRPAIGAFGWPYYPGSSMKGLFRAACRKIAPDKVVDYCGNTEKPGSLRFHGGYPIDAEWQQREKLVDIVHPQQGWQVEREQTREKLGGAFALISLYKPTLQFGISSSDPQTDWEEVWKIWEAALGSGLGCRVSSGYGLPEKRINDDGTKKLIKLTGRTLYKAHLTGTGQLPTLINGIPEFRPNIFRAALRGHAMRIFGGLTDTKTATQLVEQLFGGITGSATQGLLNLGFKEKELELDTFGRGENIYKVTGELSWLLSPYGQIEEEQRKALAKLVRMLTQFSLLFGGFGKSWRRADHRKFFNEYYDDRKSLIGCHWQWAGDSLGKDSAQVPSLKAVGQFVEAIRRAARDWMQLQNITAIEGGIASWREAWHLNNVEVWGRIAEDDEDSLAIRWLHEPYQKYDRYLKRETQSIKNTSVTGSLGQIGRLWHRIYPVVKTKPEPGKKPRIIRRLELLVIFPDNSKACNDFLEFLEREGERKSEYFQQVWPIREG